MRHLQLMVYGDVDGIAPQIQRVTCRQRRQIPYRHLERLQLLEIRSYSPFRSPCGRDKHGLAGHPACWCIHIIASGPKVHGEGCLHNQGRLLSQGCTPFKGLGRSKDVTWVGLSTLHPNQNPGELVPHGSGRRADPIPCCGDGFGCTRLHREQRSYQNNHHRQPEGIGQTHQGVGSKMLNPSPFPVKPALQQEHTRSQ